MDSKHEDQQIQYFFFLFCFRPYLFALKCIRIEYSWWLKMKIKGESSRKKLSITPFYFRSLKENVI